MEPSWLHKLWKWQLWRGWPPDPNSGWGP
jgi:hypothetical protein